MTVADVLRFFVIVGVGVLAVVTFLVAGTITGLMIFDDDSCKFCDSYPIGLWTLGLLGGLFAYSMLQVAIEQLPERVLKWYPNNKENLVLMGIVFVFFIVIFVR
jgi:hypothetical protein